jgi:uncharacterized membrane protein YoaK (UPF0700 family)
MEASEASLDRPAYEIPRDAILIALAAAAGAVDVISLLGLGGVFTANMSGNLVFLSLALGHGVTAVAFRSLAALGGFVAGAAIGARLRGPKATGPWSHGVTAALTLSAVCEVGLAVGWAASDGRPGSLVVYLLIVTSGIAMGAQSAAVRLLTDVTTTYLTGTITALIVDETGRRESGASIVRRLSVIFAFVVAGALAAWLLAHARALAPLVPMTLIGAAVIAARAWQRPGGVLAS